jgi:hypothetical protein
MMGRTFSLIAIYSIPSCGFLTTQKGDPVAIDEGLKKINAHTDLNGHYW